MDRESGSFIWNAEKEQENVKKHGVDFTTAARAFADPARKIYMDEKHSQKEPRYFCVGKAGSRIFTVRFTYRGGKIRIIGAGCWRKGEKYYEEKSDE